MSEPIEPLPVALPEDNFSELLERINTPPLPSPERAPKARVEERTVRQGLPTEYRMRHDAHYVEELATHPRSAASGYAAAVPAAVPASAALRDICQEFEGLASCFNLIDHGNRPLRERLGLALAKIGVQRSVRYAQNLRILLEDQHPLYRELRLDDLVRDAIAEFKDELRLTESTLVLDLPGSPLPVRGDAGLLRTALRACAGTAISLIETNGQAGDLHVSAFAAGDALHCEFRQHAYAIDPQQLLKLFDLGSSERSCRASAVALNAARRVAQLHSGHVEARRTSAGGCAFVFSLPTTTGSNPTITMN
jgi:signal transduction histidine kinase